jgi:hypothetical protein
VDDAICSRLLTRIMVFYSSLKDKLITIPSLMVVERNFYASIS